MIQERNIVVCIILTIITCGLYGIYWTIKLQDESLVAAEEQGPSGIVVFLLTLVTCGIYGIYWYYTLGERTDKLNGKSSNGGLLFVVLSLLGLSIVNDCVAQATLNKRANA